VACAGTTTKDTGPPFIYAEYSEIVQRSGQIPIKPPLKGALSFDCLNACACIKVILRCMFNDSAAGPTSPLAHVHLLRRIKVPLSAMSVASRKL